jgi:hypothetical protein
MKQGKLLIFLSLVNCYLARYGIFSRRKPLKTGLPDSPVTNPVAAGRKVTPHAK